MAITHQRRAITAAKKRDSRPVSVFMREGVAGLLRYVSPVHTPRHVSRPARNVDETATRSSAIRQRARRPRSHSPTAWYAGVVLSSLFGS